MGIADTGASVLCSGKHVMNILNISENELLPAKLVMRAADERKLSVLGAIPVLVAHNPDIEHKALLYIVQELNN